MRIKQSFLLSLALIVAKTAISAECSSYGVNNQFYSSYGETLNAVYCIAGGNTVWGLEAGLTSNEFKNNVSYKYLCADASDTTCIIDPDGTSVTNGTYYFDVGDVNHGTGTHYYYAIWTNGSGWSNPGNTLDGTGQNQLQSVPTMSEWGLILLAFSLFFVALSAQKRRKA